MKLDRRCFMFGLGSCIAAPFIIKDSSILMLIHDIGIIDPFSTGLYMTIDKGLLLNYKKPITITRNEFRKFDFCNAGDRICYGSNSGTVNYKMNTFQSGNRFTFWLLKGAEAQRLVTLG